MYEPWPPCDVRYIKLGSGGSWAQLSFDHGEIHFGYHEAPHELCQLGAWDEVRKHLALGTLAQGTTTGHLRQVRDFYTLGRDCLWVTLENGHLWWAYADPEVIVVPARDRGSSRMRRVVDRWHNTDRRGRPLRQDELSTRLTQVASYRQTICRIKDVGYLLRRIEGIDEPVVGKAAQARDVMTSVATEMIKGLHWADFETLVDLIFARTGWQRISRAGGTLKDFDLVLSEPATGQTAFVQVKSKADARVLCEVIERFRAAGVHDHMFFVCHTLRGATDARNQDDVHVWTGNQLGEVTVRTGLFDWLVARSR